MSSLKKAIPRRVYRERSQPEARKKFGLLEKHKDYVVRAQAYHKKQETLRRLKMKAAFKNPDEFNFKMVKSRTADEFKTVKTRTVNFKTVKSRTADEFNFKTVKSRTVNGVHRPGIEDKKYTQEELMLMKTQDTGYVLQKLQSEKKKLEMLNATLHSIDARPCNRHIYYAQDREEAKEIASQLSKKKMPSAPKDIPDDIKRLTASSYRELEARKSRVNQLEKLYMDMEMQKELQKKGRKRKLREDEISVATTRAVNKWRAERKR